MNNKRKEVKVVYDALFENHDLNNYIIEEIGKCVSKLSQSKKEKLKEYLKIEGDLEMGVINFMKKYSEQEDGKKKKLTRKSNKVVKKVVKVVEPSASMALLSVTDNKVKQSSSWYEWAKGKLLFIIPKLFQIGITVGGVMLKLSQEVLKMCSNDIYSAGACNLALISLCTYLNNTNAEMFDYSTKFMINSLQMLCYYVSPLNREKQKLDRRKKIVEDIEQRYPSGTNANVDVAKNTFIKRPFRNLRGRAMKDIEDVYDVMSKEDQAPKKGWFWDGKELTRSSKITKSKKLRRNI